VIRVLVWALDGAERDGIAGLLEDVPGVKVVGVAEDKLSLDRLLDAARADVLLVVPAPETGGDVLHDLAGEVPVIALVADGAVAVTALRAGARAVLLHPAGRAEIGTAIQAAVAGLSALSTGLLDGLLHLGGADGASAGSDALTPRELEVLALMAAGASNKVIARRLGISVHTAKFHVAGVLEKLGAHSRAEAVAIAARVGLVLL
jgi:DNA-binding NarL/FixJ family response regulator